MQKQPILAIGVLLICILMPLVCAEPLITGVFYDPEGVDTGFEWIELYNPTNQSINLGDYMLVKGNGDKPDDWTTLPSLSGFILPQSFFLIGETNVSGCDAIVKLALFNGPDSVAIRTLDNETVDLVGYGTLPFEEYSLNSPTIDVASGKSLSRKFALDDGTYVFAQTQNNSQDWQSAQEQPKNSLYQYVLPLIQNTSVTLVVPLIPTLIENITLYDDQQSKSGIQWSLVGKKQVTLQLLDEGASFNSTNVQISLLRGGVAKILTAQYVEIESENISDAHITVIFTTQLASDLSAGNYSLLISLITGENTTMSASRNVELLPSIGMVVCDDMILTRTTQNPHAAYTGSCLIQNVGNVPAHFGLNLTFGDDLLTLPYVILNETYVLLSDSELLLAAGEQTKVEIVANVSRFIKSGSYLGTLQVRAWATS